MEPARSDRSESIASRRRAADWRTAALLIGIFCCYALSAGGRLNSIDEVYVYRTAQAIAERGSMTIHWPGDNPPERNVSRFSLLPSLIAAPFYRVAMLLDAVSGEADGEELRIFVASLSSCLLTTLAAWLVYVWLVAIGYARSVGRVCALLYALGTMAFAYSSTCFVQVSTAPALAWCCLAIIQRLPKQAFFAFALTVWSRSDMVVLLAPFAAFLLFSYRNDTDETDGRPTASRSKAGAGPMLGSLLLGGAAGLALTAATHWLRGDPLLQGAYQGEAFSTPAALGLYSLLFSSGKGLFWFSPIAGVGMLGLIARAQDSAPMRLALYVIVTQLVVFAQWWTWHGGVSWGPRLLLPALPLCIVGIAPLFSAGDRLRQWVAAAALASLAVGVWSAIQPPLGYAAARSSVPIEENETIYVPQNGPFGAEARFETPWLFRQESDAVRLAGYGLVGLAAVCLAIGLSKDVRSAATALRSPPVLWLAGAAALLYLTPGAPPLLKSADDPEQYSRMDQVGGAYRGKLDAPVRGEYVFYNDSARPLNLRLGNAEVLSDRQQATAVFLEQGLTPIEIRDSGSSPIGNLRWTIPGGAYYKQQVPRSRLAPAKLQTYDRLVRYWLQWRWAVYLLYVLAGCVWLTRQ